MPALARVMSRKRDPAILKSLPRAALPIGGRLSQFPIDRGPFFGAGLVAGEMDIQLVLLNLLNPDRGCFELRGAGFRIYSVNRKVVRGYLLVEVDREEREAGPQPGVEAHRGHHRSPARGDQH